MNEIEQCWKKGFLDGWNDQSAMRNPPEPTIPAFPGGIPLGHEDPCKYAYDEGRVAGALARIRVQAGIT